MSINASFLDKPFPASPEPVPHGDLSENADAGIRWIDTGIRPAPKPHPLASPDRTFNDSSSAGGSGLLSAEEHLNEQARLHEHALCIAALRTSTFKAHPIPGSAEKPTYDENQKSRSGHVCGEVSGAAACATDRHHFVRYFGEDCGHSSCPVCWNNWCRKASIRAADRVRGYIRACEHMAGALHEAPDEPGAKYTKGQIIAAARYLSHVIFSTNPTTGDIHPNMTIDQIWAIVHPMIKASGMIGYAPLFHPFRLTDEAKELLKPLVGKNYTDTGTEHDIKYWELVHKNALNMPNGMADYVVWGPHVHVIGYGYLKKSDVFEKETGWMYKKRRYVSAKVERDQKTNMVKDPLRGLMHYLLTHAEVHPGKQTIRYGGAARAEPAPER